MLHRLFAAFLFAFALGFSGCGGGGGGGDSPAPAGAPGGGGPPAPPAIPPVPTGTPVVFLSVATDTTSVVQGITIQSDTQAILRYVPSTNAVVQTDQNNSFSFAQSTLLPFTQGDKLYAVNQSNSVARFNLYPVSLQTQGRVNDIFIGSTFPSGCVAVVGDDLIFRDGANWKKLAGISTATATTLPTVIGSANAPNNCNFNLGTANGRLFDVQFTDNAGATADTFVVRERSTATGAFLVTTPNPLGSFQEDVNPGNYASYLFAFDGTFMYMARRIIANSRIEIWRWDYTTPAVLPVLRATIIPASSLTGPLRMDVRNGFIAMLVDTGTTGPFLEQRLLTYNDTTNAAVDKVLGRGFYAVQVLFLP